MIKISELNLAMAAVILLTAAVLLRAKPMPGDSIIVLLLAVIALLSLAI